MAIYIIHNNIIFRSILKSFPQPPAIKIDYYYWAMTNILVPINISRVISLIITSSIFNKKKKLGPNGDENYAKKKNKQHKR